MFTNRLVSAALLLLLTYVPIPALGRSIPLSLSTRDITTEQLSSSSFTLNTVDHTGTYPRLTTLMDGSILCGYTQIDSSGVHTLQVLRSTDGGSTFNNLSTITQGTGDMDNVNLIQDPVSKTVLAAFRNHDMNAAGEYTEYRITVCGSDDGGNTWTFRSQAVTSSVTGEGCWEPFMRIDPDKNIQLTYSGELAADNQETFRVNSSDGGSTWTAPENLHVHPVGAKLRDGMQGIVTLKDDADGREALCMVFETNERSPAIFNVEYALSYDGGASWTRGDVYVPQGDRCAGSPQIAVVNGQGIVCIFMTDEDAAVTDWPAHAAVKAVVATGLSGGEIKWSAPSTVQVEQSAWPGLMTTPDGNVMAVYQHSGNVEGKLLSWTAA